MAEEDSANFEALMKKKRKKEEKEREKEEKKKSKKRKKPGDGNDDNESVDKRKSDDKKSKKKKTKESKTRLKSKKEEKAELMKSIPLKNEDGIAYTKFQIRQMLKRVKRGLPPVATAKELEEKRQNEARLRREEEAELAGLVGNRENLDEDGDPENEGEHESDHNGKDNDAEVEDQNQETSTPFHETCTVAPSNQDESGTAKKKPKRNKPIPSDYICQACLNRHTPAHWIYDCPDKVTVRGTNKKKKKERGINDPDSKKVFVSGLPFDAKAKAVEDFFSVANGCGTISTVRLVKFNDTGRCNGQAYVSFDTDAGAQRAIKLSGTILDPEALSASSEGNNSKKKKDGKDVSKQKTLKLKVSKVLNRRKTKIGAKVLNQ